MGVGGRKEKLRQAGAGITKRVSDDDDIISVGEVQSSEQKGLPSTPQLTPYPSPNTHLEEKLSEEVGPKRDLRLINRFGFLA